MLQAYEMSFTLMAAPPCQEDERMLALHGKQTIDDIYRDKSSKLFKFSDQVSQSQKYNTMDKI
jgi:hypothetical protein